MRREEYELVYITARRHTTDHRSSAIIKRYENTPTRGRGLSEREGGGSGHRRHFRPASQRESAELVLNLFDVEPMGVE